MDTAAAAICGWAYNAEKIIHGNPSGNPEALLTKSDFPAESPSCGYQVRHVTSKSAVRQASLLYDNQVCHATSKSALRLASLLYD
jgi:hypothetical protein